jgi:iron(III) transport system permease protein
MPSNAPRRLGRIATWAFIGVLSYLALVPLIRLQSLAFSGNSYRDAFTAPRMGETLLSTFALAIGSLAIALVLGTALAVAATQLSPRLRLLQALPIFPIVLPTLASVLGWTFLLSPYPGYLNALMRHLPWWQHLVAGPVNIYTLQWMVILTGFNLSAFIYLFVSAGLRNINSELLEAAQIGGSSALGVLFRVTLPLLRPVLVYGSGVALLLGLGQFTVPLLLGTESGISVLTTDILVPLNQAPPEYGPAAAIGSPLLVFGVAIVILQKLVIGDQARFVTHGGKQFRSGAESSKLAAASIILYTFVTTLLPIIGLVIVALSRYWTGDVNPRFFTLDNLGTMFDRSNIVAAVQTSLVSSIIAVAIALLVGFIAASLLLQRGKQRLARGALDFIVSLPLGTPAVLFGVAFLLTYTHEPLILYGTPWVFVVVYVTLMLPFTTRMQLSGMLALGKSYSEASRVSGVGVLETNARIVLPLMRSTMGGAAALMFVLLANEFAASLLVRSATTQVMGSVLYDYYANGIYPLVACIALAMTLVTALGVILAVALGGSDIFNKL